MTGNNPFTSKTFVQYWAKHFLRTDPINLSIIKGILCYKSNFLGCFFNVGKNLTKGINYVLDTTTKKALKGKTVVLYDVLPNRNLDIDLKALAASKIGLHIVKQYPGYLINLDTFETFEEYMSVTFKKSSRYKLRKYKKRFEQSFDISFKSIDATISQTEYDFIFQKFRQLLVKRFQEKKIYNNNLDNDEWEFYKDVTLPLIKEEKATLFVIYNKQEPISITLAYFSKERIFDAITVFDIDYAKFHLGSIKIMYLINWAIENKKQILDFSKGHFDYKTRWSNEKYNFYYHVIYDKTSFKSSAIAFLLKQFFQFKQGLRNKGINEAIHRLTYRLKHKNEKSQSFEFFELHENLNIENYQKLELNDSLTESLKKVCFEFLYLTQEKQEDLRIYKSNEKDVYFINGKEACKGIKLLT